MLRKKSICKDEQTIGEESFDDSYQNTRHLFGEPYQELKNYFSGLKSRGSAIDLGCGQGRDALFLASLGYRVTAIDNSRVGIDQLLADSASRGLSLEGVVVDIMSYQTQTTFDVILFDMVLHGFEEKAQREQLKRWSANLTNSGFFCIVIPDDVSSEGFIDMLCESGQAWKITEEIVIHDVPQVGDEEIDFKFVMLRIERSIHPARAIL